MKLDIASQVRRLGNHTNLQTVIREAVVNSIQAGATEIDVTFHYSKGLFDNDVPKPVNGLEVCDNGHGFTREDIESFCVYGSQHKLDVGCKGVGRICFLKVFDKVVVDSDVETQKIRVHFEFDTDFENSRVLTEDCEEIASSQTKIKFSGIRSVHEKPYDLATIRDNLYSHVLPMLYLKRKEADVTIRLHGDGDDVPSICTQALPSFERMHFAVQEVISNDKQRFDFFLHYAVEPSGQPVLSGYYCANHRTVHKFNNIVLGSERLKISPVPGKKITLLVTGQYLDEKCSEERNRFEIFPHNTDLYNRLSWEMINRELRRALKAVFDEQTPEVVKRNARELEEAKEENLHLADYFENDQVLGGKLDIDRIVRSAEKNFLEDKLKFKKSLRSKTSDKSTLIRQASYFAGKELIEYVLMRDKVISMLEAMHEEDDPSEDVLHNLLLKKGESTNAIEPLPLSENNIWLLDDKFMSYCYAASDKTIRVAVRELGYENESSQRPDIAIYFQNERDNHNAVIVELKALGLSAEKKFAGLLELREYADRLRTQEGLDSIWYYLITKIDDQFERQLKVDQYKRLFSVNEKTYFKYYEEIGLNLYILSSDTLIADAKARNKTFIDLVKDSCKHSDQTTDHDSR